MRFARKLPVCLLVLIVFAGCSGSDGPTGVDNNDNINGNGVFEPAGIVYESGLPPGTLMRSIWNEFGNQNAFAVGFDGLILHYNGSRWEHMESPATKGLNDIWFNADGLGWAVGDQGCILHFDGSEWAIQESGTVRSLYAVFGRAKDKVPHVVGDQGTLLQFDGDEWSQLLLPDAFETTSIVPSALGDIWIADSGELFITERFGEFLFRVTGTTVTQFEAPNLPRLNALWGSSNTNVLVVGNEYAARFTGSELKETPVPPGFNYQDVSGASARNYVAVGRTFSDGIIIEFDGDEWTEAERLPDQRPDAIAAIGEDKYILIGSGFAELFDGTSTTSIRDESFDVFDMWAFGPTDMFSVGNDDVAHFDGTAWTRVPHPFGSAMRARSVFGNASGSIFVVGGGVWFFDRTSWQEVPNPLGENWSHVTGTPNGDIYVSIGPKVARLRNGVWTKLLENAEVLGTRTDGLWGAPTGEVFVGAGRHLAMWNGSSWELIRNTIGEIASINDVWGTSADNVYAGGDYGLFRFDGENVHLEFLDGGDGIYTIRAFAENNVYVLSGGNYLAHFNGVGWKQVAMPLSMQAIAGADDTFMAGSFGGVIGRLK